MFLIPDLPFDFSADSLGIAQSQIVICQAETALDMFGNDVISDRDEKIGEKGEEYFS